jgi:hypothetical protein
MIEYSQLRNCRFLGVASKQDAAAMVGSFTVRIDARGNWWNHATGPTTCCNVPGRGVPITLLTEFTPWCLDDQCQQLSAASIGDNSTEYLYAPDRSRLEELSGCSLDTLCTPTDFVVSYVGIGSSVTISVLAVVVCTYLVRRIRRRDVYSKLVLRVAAVANIISSILIIVESMFYLYGKDRGNLPWLIGRGHIAASGPLSAASVRSQFTFSLQSFVFSVFAVHSLRGFHRDEHYFHACDIEGDTERNICRLVAPIHLVIFSHLVRRRHSNLLDAYSDKS